MPSTTCLHEIAVVCFQQARLLRAQPQCCARHRRDEYTDRSLNWFAYFLIDNLFLSVARKIRIRFPFSIFVCLFIIYLFISLQSICYKIAPEANRKSQHSSVLISGWLRDYPQENIVPLYFMIKYAQN